MSYKALYRMYRPTSFNDVVGQEHIVKALKNAIAQNKIGHAYLFCGPRGTGKTTVAKLLAKAVNCEDPANAPCNKCENCIASDNGTHQDIIEIDAASNNGVDEIRNLIEKVKYAPIQGKYKIYIIDEVHMLSPGAFNALLKTLEEPPEHIIFILATTEPHKVLPTIISRCQRYDFSKVKDEDMIHRLKDVAASEGIQVEENAYKLITSLADGGMRDALSIMDQCIAYSNNEITVKSINDIYGIATIEEKMEMLNDIISKNTKKLLNKIQTLSEGGTDIRRLTDDLTEICKECVIYIYTKDDGLLSNLTPEQASSLTQDRIAAQFLTMIDALMEASVTYRNATNVTSYFEVACLKMINATDRKEVKEVKEEPVISTQVDYEENIIKTVQPPKKVEPKVEQVQPKVEKKKMLTPALNEDYMVGLLVQCNKEEKAKDVENFTHLDDKAKNFDLARYANLLKQAYIGASGKDCLIVVTPIQPVANSINEAKMNYELYVFIKEEFNMDKMIFAITEEDFKNVTSSFAKKMKENTLPLPTPIVKYVIEEKVEPKEESAEERLIGIFGEGNIEFIEEEK